MAGVANDILSAYAMPAGYAPDLDHTYASAESGMSWGCFGRDTGGAMIISGGGSSIVADCLSHRRSPAASKKGNYSVYAGIIYGVTGVCHQAANRILYPSGKKLPASVNGFALSTAAYDEFGLRNWMEFSSCMASGPNSVQSFNDRNSTFAFLPRDRRSLSMTTMATGEPSPSWRPFEEMRAFLKDHLGHTLPDDQVRKLQNLKSTFREHQSHLQNLLLEEEIDKERYLHDFNEAMESYMKAARAIMGDEDFTTVFGASGYNPGQLIDREVFYARD